MSADLSKFPLVIFRLSEDFDIEKLKKETTRILKYAKKQKSKMSIVIESGDFDGFGVFDTVQLVKHLLDHRPYIEKYFNRSCILLEDDKGMFSYLLSMYTPVRPLKTFKLVDKLEALEWVTTIDG
jgi:hypothetical protein